MYNSWFLIIRPKLQRVFVCLAILSLMLIARTWIYGSKIKLNFHDDTRVVRWSGLMWRTVPKVCSKNYDFPSAVLKSPAGNIPMFVQSSQKGGHALIYTDNLGEQGLDLVFEELESDPDLGLLNIGPHLEPFTLTAASMGHKVVSVGSSMTDITRLCQSVKRNGLVDYVTLAYATLSPSRKGHMDEEDMENATKHNRWRFSVVSFRIDDLVYIIDFQRVLLTLNIERNVYYVMSDAHRLFKNFDVRGVLMKWAFHRKSRLPEHVIRFFTDRDFLPFSIVWSDHLLNPRFRAKWPYRVFWRKIDKD